MPYIFFSQAPDFLAQPVILFSEKDRTSHSQYTDQYILEEDEP